MSQQRWWEIRSCIAPWKEFLKGRKGQKKRCAYCRKGTGKLFTMRGLELPAACYAGKAWCSDACMRAGIDKALEKISKRLLRCHYCDKEMSDPSMLPLVWAGRGVKMWCSAKCSKADAKTDQLLETWYAVLSESLKQKLGKYGQPEFVFMYGDEPLQVLQKRFEDYKSGRTSTLEDARIEADFNEAMKELKRKEMVSGGF